MAEHLRKPGTKIFEVWNNGEFMAAIYPTEKGIKVVSKHLPYVPENPEEARKAIEIDCKEFPTSILIDLTQESDVKVLHRSFFAPKIDKKYPRKSRFFIFYSRVFLGLYFFI